VAIYITDDCHQTRAKRTQTYCEGSANVRSEIHTHAILILQIREGRIAKIRSEQEAEPLPKLALAFESTDVLNLRDIEQSSDNLRRLPSLRPRIQIEVGQVPDTSDVVIDLEAQRPLRLGFVVNDGGNKTTGRIQGNATLSWGNPLGLSDMAYITKGQDLGGRDSCPRGSLDAHLSRICSIFCCSSSRFPRSYLD
jgi:hemolysin activation/secretion protein